MKDKNNKHSRPAVNVIRLSPPKIFERLLGEPEDTGYDEDMLELIREKSANFTCNSKITENLNKSDKDIQHKSVKNEKFDSTKE